MKINKDEIRRKIFFSDIYDYNYLLYNLIIVLNSLECVSEKKSFHDHRSLGLIFELMNSRRLTEIYIRKSINQIQYNNQESIEMLDLYIRSKKVTKQLTKLLIALSHKNIVKIINNISYFSVWLNRTDLIIDFLSTDLFQEDRNIFSNICKSIGYLRTKGYEKVITQVLDDRGITSWQI